MNILNPGYDLNLRPMRYPQFYEMYRNAIKNTWTVEEVDLSHDLADLSKMSKAEQHLIKRLVAFATGDSIVANNLVLNLYQHINSPEARMYLSRQLYEEALHVQFYLTLLDTYLPDEKERNEAFKAIQNIPSIKQKGDFCFKWMDSIDDLKRLETKEDRRKFILNLACFASCIEGLFFLQPLPTFTSYAQRAFTRACNWYKLGFRDESCHMSFAFAVIDQVRKEEPDLFDDKLEKDIIQMLNEAIECEIVLQMMS